MKVLIMSCIIHYYLEAKDYWMLQKSLYNKIVCMLSTAQPSKAIHPTRLSLKDSELKEVHTS